MNAEKHFSKAHEKFTKEGEFRSFTIYHKKTGIVIGGDREVVNFVNENDEITIKQIKQKIEELSASADVPEYKRIVPYPRLPVKYKSSLWSCQVARKVLKDYLEAEGFGSGINKCYGRAGDEPDSWPDTISWANFKGPSFAKLETCNEIIECLLESRQIDVNSYHVAAHNEERLENEADQEDEADNNQYNPPDQIEQDLGVDGGVDNSDRNTTSVSSSF